MLNVTALEQAVALLTGPEGLTPGDMLTLFTVEVAGMEPQEGADYVAELRSSVARFRAQVKAEADACGCAECAAERFDSERSREVSSVQSAMALAVRAGAFSRKGEA